MLSHLSIRDFAIVDRLELEFRPGFTALTGVTAEFAIDSLPPMGHWLREQALEGDANRLLLRRVVDANGRSRAFINGHAATVNQLREAGERLVDIHGQHAHQSLLR